MIDRQDELAKMAQAAMNGILDASRASDGTSYIDPDLAGQALIACLASIIDADERVKTRKDIREACELAARALRMQVEALRRHFEATGEHSGWDAKGVWVQ